VPWGGARLHGSARPDQENPRPSGGLRPQQHYALRHRRRRLLAGGRCAAAL